jgi:glutamate carboxypeptidase
VHFLPSYDTLRAAGGAKMDFNLYFKSRQGEMVNLLKNIVTRESPSQDKKAVDACSSFVAGEFRKVGAKISRFPQKKTGDFYLVEYPASAKAATEGQVLILTHIDTVWPVGKIVKMPFFISGSRVFGPGVLDMKSGLVMAVFALKALHQLSIRPAKRIAVFINAAEEIGDEASNEMILRLAKKSTYVLCLEPALPGGALKTQRKGRLVLRLEVKGKAAHAGTPEKGINAIDELMAQIRKLKRLTTRDVTMNLGQIGGGEKANIVAEAAWAILDWRFWNSRQQERIVGTSKQLEPTSPGAKIKSSLESLTPPMEKTKSSTQLLLEVKKIASTLGLVLEDGKTGGGSDASIASSLGVPTLDGLGPDGDGIHAENEHLLLPSLIQRTALLTEMIRHL